MQSRCVVQCSLRKSESQVECTTYQMPVDRLTVIEGFRMRQKVEVETTWS